MIKHIVLWKLHSQTEHGTSSEAAQKAKTILEGLLGVVPTLKKIEIGFNINPDSTCSDLALYSEFDSWDAFVEYRDHPEHKKVGEFIRVIASGRSSIDYEV